MKKILSYLLLLLAVCIVIAVLLFSIRQKAAKTEIERDGQTAPAAATVLETTTRLEILPLYEEARADESLEFGHGVSYLIRTDSAAILMDIGNNPNETSQTPALQNLQTLGIVWEDINAIVITHPHPDHVGGLKAWQDQTISFGDFAGSLNKVLIYTPIPMIYSDATLIHSAEPTLISSDLATTGVIPFLEVWPLSLTNPKGYEQALVVNVQGNGLVLITGCGHPTLETLVERAEALYGQPVVGVVGGLHYGDANAEELQPHIQFLETRQPKLVALSPHDSESEVVEAFRSAFPDSYQPVKVGEAIRFP